MEKPIFEAEIIEGLEDFARRELKGIGARFDHEAPYVPGSIRFRLGKSQQRLGRLRLVNSVYRVHVFDVPRPKALLGQQHLDRILQSLSTHIAEIGKKNVRSFRLEAAGKESAVFQRLTAQLSQRLNLPHDAEAADLLIRIKPAPTKDKEKKNGWEMLVRLHARPLATRSWRTFNYPGAIAGPIAAAMLQMVADQPKDNILNLMCGSGTLLAELEEEDGLVSAGCDLNFSALSGAKNNLTAVGRSAYLQQADATQLPYASGRFDLILADLPWGQLIGEGQDMGALYQSVLTEAGRVAVPGGSFVVITQLKKQFYIALEKQSFWTQMQKVPLKMARTTPDIYLLRKF